LVQDRSSPIVGAAQNAQCDTPGDTMQEFYFSMCVIQLVEDLYFEFELDDSRWFTDPRIGGRRYLFQTWKKVPMVASA
jgi:hypothetical protein